MYENQQIIEKSPSDRLRELLVGALGFGVILASTHGAPFPDHHKDLTPSEFTSKIISELHIHNDFQVKHNHILVDPKYLRSVRSEGDKVAERDGLRGNWDVYQA